jgi:DNA-binding PadR family transcriptional regulator
MAVRDIILALIAQGKRPIGYDLKKALEESPVFARIESTQIYKVLDGLLRDGLIVAEDDGDRKRYLLTPAGKKSNLVWMNCALELPEMKNAFLQRLYFAFGDYERAMAYIQEYDELLREEIAKATREQKRRERAYSEEDPGDDVSGFQEPTPHIDDMFAEQVEKHNLAMLNAELTWLTSLKDALHNMQ